MSKGSEALKGYLAEYLDTLHSAGNHVLFSLPEFGQNGIPAPIDYSLMGAEHPFVNNIHGVTVEAINEYMHSIWLKSAMFAGDISQVDNWRLRSLSEYSSVAGSTQSGIPIRFTVQLGAPRVDILCTKEVIVYFNIDEVRFFDSDDIAA